MSNLSRNQRARKQRPTPKISRTEQIRTVELYLDTESSNRAGEELGLSGAAVRDRLFALGVPLRPQGFSSYADGAWAQKVRKRLEELRAT